MKLVPITAAAFFSFLLGIKLIHKVIATDDYNGKF
jgi:hypothetical protein